MGEERKPPFSIDPSTQNAIARIKRRDHCLCLTKPSELHSEAQNEQVPGWAKALTWVANLTKSRAEVLEPSSIPWEEWMGVITLPSSIESLATVKAVRLYGSHLRRIPPEIGRMHALRELDVYTSYSLHWLPYELTRCRQLKKSRMSTRAMFGNRKTHLPFPRLDAALRELTPSTCSVCDEPFSEAPEPFWHTLPLGADWVPLLIHSCSAACTQAVPDAPVGYSKRPHKGGKVSIVIRSLPDFIEFARTSHYELGSASVTPEVWEQVAKDKEAMLHARFFPKLPMKVLRAAAAHPHEHVRCSVAGRPLKKDIYLRLAQDAEVAVRLEVAQNPGTPRAVLENLAGDASRKVRKCAVERLKSYRS